ncbi:MAG: carbohydrate kinase family protein [Lachnospiraceae bacterium]|nr:carbohydrate kinase family protein [Lachnospiraceae bacterium]
MSKIVVAGITQIETIVKVDKIPLEYEPLRSQKNSIFTAIGGDAYNAALALKYLGDDVELFSAVGIDLNPNMLNPPNHKVEVSTQYVVPVMQSTPTSVILFDKERHEQIYEDIKDLRDVSFDMSMVLPIVADSDIVLLSNANFCRPFIEIAQNLKKRIVVNIHNFLRDKEIYNKDFLKAANILYFSDDTIPEDPYEFIKSIEKEYETEIIILGQGTAGLIIYDRVKDTTIHYNIVKTNEVVNTSGAGNALLACFLHFYSQTGDSTFSIKNAMLFASYKIGFIGTSNGFMTSDEVSCWHKLIWG